MLRVLTDLPDTVVGIEAFGRIEASDYESILDPAVDAALRRHDRIRLLYVLGEEFEGFSAGAAWKDTKLGIGHRSAWERIAVVTDRGWIHDALKALGWMLPGEVRAFRMDERTEATAWIAG
jgi:hypothetical protein